jgi:hypothetical protein
LNTEYFYVELWPQIRQGEKQRKGFTMCAFFFLCAYVFQINSLETTTGWPEEKQALCYFLTPKT